MSEVVPETHDLEKCQSISIQYRQDIGILIIISVYIWRHMFSHFIFRFKQKVPKKKILTIWNTKWSLFCRHFENIVSVVKVKYLNQDMDRY